MKKDSSSARLTTLDVARGTAILMICTLHFVDVYSHPHLNGSPHPLSVTILNAIGRVSTPAFFLVSGMVLGYLSEIESDRFERIRLHLLDRALFLLTAGHLLIALTWATRIGFLNSLGLGYVTDTVAVCVIGSALLFRYIRSILSRLVVGSIVYLIAWASWTFWHPNGPVLLTLRGILLGPDENGHVIFYDPILPWLGVYLIGSCVGSWLSRFEPANFHLAGRKILAYSAVVFAIAISANVIILALQFFGVAQIPHHVLALGKKYPPGPSYIMLFGSSALLLVGGILILLRANHTSMLRRLTECIGRNSFPIFVVQFFFYYTALFLIETQFYWPTPLMAFVFYLTSLWCLVWFSRVFDRLKINQYLTVGLPALREILVHERGVAQFRKVA
jgi:uncharacterized membrane protein